MTNEEKISYWINLSNNDFTVAETLLKNGHYLYTGFMCHQAVEKIFKGYYAKVKNDTPPFKHDLEYLAQQSGLYNLLNDEQISFIEKLNPLNIEARYPDYKNKVTQYLTNEKILFFFEKTKDLLQWTKEKI
ncbi:MAG: HEPN domain-containing protein [Treponema sp.]|nr:HEPN domain-containing protein [Treponema sp.]